MPRRAPVHRGTPITGGGSDSKRLADKRRGSAAGRGYDHTWRKLRDSYLSRNPLCVMCLEHGRITGANVVDHIIPIAKAPELRLTECNLRALCKRCHDSHTARTQGFAKPRGGPRAE